MKTVKTIKKTLILAIITSCAIPTISKSAALPISIEERAAALKEARAAAIPAREQDNLNQELIDAIVFNDPSRVLAILDRGADPDTIEEFGLPPLFLAVQHKRINILQLLISAGADLNMLLFPRDETALMRITALFQDQPNEKKINQKIMNILIEAGANLNVQDHPGTTVLMQTIKRSNYKLSLYLINFLIKAGADINVKNWQGQDVRQLAKQSITEHLDSPEETLNTIATRDALVEAIAARDRATQECARTWLMQSQDYLMKKPLPIPPLTNIMQEYAIPTSCDPVAIAKQRSADATIRQLERAEETLERAIIFRSIAAEQGIEAAQAWALATKRRT